MCELFGLTSAEVIDIREYLKNFYHHSIHHPHGWGLFRETDGNFEIIKEPVRAVGSRILHDVIQQTQPQKYALAHIRLATVGSVRKENCHPYVGTDLTGRNWTMIHNGTIYSSRNLYQYLKMQKGDTDSERAFLYLLDQINQAQGSHPLSPEERFEIVQNTVMYLSPRNKLNLMIFDGELLYIHKNMKDTLKYKKLENGFLFATTPLDQDTWEEFPLAQLHAFRNGALFRKGQRHDGVFIPTLEYISAMDAMYI